MSQNTPPKVQERSLYEQLISPGIRPRTDSEIATAYEHMEARNLCEKIENMSDAVRDAARSVLLLGLPMAITLDIISGIGRGPIPARETFTEKLGWRNAKQRAYERMWADRDAFSKKSGDKTKK